MILRLAWRNAWRNPRRTGVVVAAVSIGIAGALLTMALNFGMIYQMVETAIESDLGHIQVHAPGFDANPELSVRLPDGGRAAAARLEAQPGVRAVARRVRGEGLVSSPRASAGVRVVAVEPERESRITRIAESITAGSYLDGDARRVLLGGELARRLEVEIGDKVVLSVQDLSGELTGEALRVGGLFETPSAVLDESTLFLRLSEGQALFGLGDAVSEVVAVADRRSRVRELRERLAAELGDRAEVRSWEELQPALVYMIDVFDQTSWLIYAAVFVAMAFGIANVLLMTVYERTREIGIMRAIGFGRGRLVATLLAEAAVVTLVGLLLGFALALGSVAWLGDGLDLSYFARGLGKFGIGTRIVPVLRPSDFAIPVAVAGVTALLAAAWPAWRAVRLRPAEAVRQT
jgi:ABC-type lipoprotein release transport system permease subunit